MVRFAGRPARDTISEVRYRRSVDLVAGVLEAHVVVERVCFCVTQGGLESLTMAR
jgi:hypothetical protein